jgi:hypothetical protein
VIFSSSEDWNGAASSSRARRAGSMFALVADDPTNDWVREIGRKAPVPVARDPSMRSEISSNSGKVFLRQGFALACFYSSLRSRLLEVIIRELTWRYFSHTSAPAVTILRSPSHPKPDTPRSCLTVSNSCLSCSKSSYQIKNDWEEERRHTRCHLLLMA